MKRISKLYKLKTGDRVEIEYAVGPWLPDWIKAIQLGHAENKLEDMPNVKLWRYWYLKDGVRTSAADATRIVFDVEIIKPDTRDGGQVQEAGVLAGVLATAIAVVGVTVWLSLREIRLKSSVDADLGKTPGGQIATATKGVAGLGLVALLGLGAYIYFKR